MCSARTLVYVAYAGDTFFDKLWARYHTLAYVGVRCHTSNLSENFVHAHNFQRMPTYYVRHTLLIRNITLCIRSRTLHVRNSHVHIRLHTSQPVGSFVAVV